MKKIIIFVIFKLIIINGFSQGEITSRDILGDNDIQVAQCENKRKDRYYRQFIVPIDSNGQSINNGIELTINAVFNNNNYSLRLLDLQNLNAPSIINKPLNINNNQAVDTLFFNGNSSSTVYRIMIWNNNTNSEDTIRVNINGVRMPFETYIVTERNRTNTFNNNYSYKMSWVDWWVSELDDPVQFPNGSANRFLTNAEDALKYSYEKQVTDWNLCSALPNNVPDDSGDDAEDGGNEFDMFINGYDRQDFPYRGYRSHFAVKRSSYRNMTIDYNIEDLKDNKYENIYDRSNDEKAVLTSTVGHEFFHNIQHSYYNGNYNNNSDEMKWLVEGQASFMQTLIMDAFSTPNEEYSLDRAYYQRTKYLMKFLFNNMAVNGAPLYPNGPGIYLKDMSSELSPYLFAVFWRYLFDTFLSNNQNPPTIQAKLNIIRESVRNLTDPATIQADMDNVLAAGNGNYNSLNELLINFAEDLYFCHDNEVSGFENVDNLNMYTNLRNIINTDLYNVKNTILSGQPSNSTHSELVFDGNLPYQYIYSSNAANNQPRFVAVSTLLLQLNLNLSRAYQIQSREVFLTQPGNDLKVELRNDLDGDGNNTHVRAYIVDAQGAILSSKSFDFNGQSSQTFNLPVINNDDRLVIICIRTDINENNTGDLVMELFPVGNRTCAEFEANNVKIDAGANINFTNLSCSNATTYQWDFPGGNPANSNLANPQVSYANAGNFDVTLTAINANDTVVETKQDYITVNRVIANEFDFNIRHELKDNSYHNYGFTGQVTIGQVADVANWEWSFSSGNVQPGNDPALIDHIFDVDDLNRSATLKLTFTDGTSKSKTKRFSICGF